MIYRMHMCEDKAEKLSAFGFLFGGSVCGMTYLLTHFVVASLEDY